VADDTDDRRYPALGRARRAQALLVAVAFFTAMDIYVVSLLVEPIKHDLGLSDVQVGLANTTVLYAAYALFCVPMGMLADRISRVRMLVAAMLLWCIGLAVTGLSHSLALLMASKAILGIANAVTLPASLSLLADYFAPRHRAMATSSYAIGQGLGQGGAIIVGGLGLGVLTTMAATTPGLPFGLSAWRVLSLAFAAFGLILVPLLALLREPARMEVRDRGASSFRELWAFRAFLLPLLTGTLFLSGMATGVLSWIPPALTRLYGQQPAQFAGWFGAVSLGATVAGLVAGGKLADHLLRQGERTQITRAAALAALCCIPASFMAMMPSLVPFAAAAVVFMIAYAIAISVPVIAINFRIPNELRGLVMGLYVVTVSVGGAVSGPLVALASGWLGGEAHLGESMALVGAPFALLAAACLGWTARRSANVEPA
jgi:MFS family permease